MNPGTSKEHQDDLLFEAQSMVDQHNYRAARALLENALEQHQESPEIYELLAICYASMGRLDDAELTLQTGILSHPHNPRLQKSLARIYRYLGDYDDAISALMDAAAQVPDDDQVWAQLGISHEMNGAVDQAEVAFSRAIRLNPERGANYLGLARLMKSQGKNREFKDLLARADQHMERESDYNRACLAALREQPAEALRLLERFLRHNPYGRHWAARDLHFSSLREQPEFDQLVHPNGDNGESALARQEAEDDGHIEQQQQASDKG